MRRCAHRFLRDRVVDKVLRQPGGDDVVGNGRRIVHTPFSWWRGFVTKPVPPTHVVEPDSVPLQYCVWMFAQPLPPTFWKNAFRYVCSVLLE